MRYQDPDWVPPSRWSDGVTAGLLDYSLMVNRYMPQQGNLYQLQPLRHRRV